MMIAGLESGVLTLSAYVGTDGGLGTDVGLSVEVLTVGLSSMMAWLIPSLMSLVTASTVTFPVSTLLTLLTGLLMTVVTFGPSLNFDLRSFAAALILSAESLIEVLWVLVTLAPNVKTLCIDATCFSMDVIISAIELLLVTVGDLVVVGVLMT